MTNQNKQTDIIRFFPDWPVFRRLAAQTKIKSTYKTALPEEDVLRGEQSLSNRHLIVEECKKRWPSTVEKTNAKINTVFQTISYYMDGQVDLDDTREDMMFKFFAYGFQPNEYFAFRLDRKTPEETREFISGRLRMKYRCQMNNILQAYIFNDKSETYKRFKEYYHREVIDIEEAKDFPKFKEFTSKFPLFVKKQVYLAQGESVELVDMRKIGQSDKDYFNSLIKKGKHVLEEKIIQTPDMAQFNESSVNTVRAITFNTRHGFEVPYCMIRTGRPGAFVDNSGAGGVQAEIDFETGEVVSDGYDELGGKYRAHPASGVVFKGFRLPDWDQLKDLVFSSASRVPLIRFIGWDLAHTEEGWVIVEGNENCYTIALQQIRDKGMRNTFEKIMQDMDLYVSL